MARMICVDVDKRITFEEIQARCTPHASCPMCAFVWRLHAYPTQVCAKRALAVCTMPREHVHQTANTPMLIVEHQPGCLEQPGAPLPDHITLFQSCACLAGTAVHQHLILGPGS